MLRKCSILAIAAFLTACTAESADRQTVTLVGPSESVEFQVELAATPEQRQQGLMNRTSLPASQGMLFIFDEEQVLSFWMKNTLIPLDILYFDQAGHLVSRTTMQPCTSDPCRTYSSKKPAAYALELSAGTADELGITDAWRLDYAW